MLQRRPELLLMPHSREPKMCLPKWGSLTLRTPMYRFLVLNRVLARMPFLRTNFLERLSYGCQSSTKTGKQFRFGQRRLLLVAQEELRALLLSLVDDPSQARASNCTHFFIKNPRWTLQSQLMEKRRLIRVVPIQRILFQR